MSYVSGVVLFLTGLFFGGCAQYAGYYPYPYQYYPNIQPYSYRQPCQSSCGNVQPTSYCQYLPCYSQQQRYYNPYYSPYNYYNTRRFNYPYINYYSNSKKSPDPYANVPVEIIDDDSVIDQKKLPTFNNKNQYANVPVEIIDDNEFDEFFKQIPVLPKRSRASDSNYTVSYGPISEHSVVQTKPISATITRSFQPLENNPDFRIDFLNGKPIDGNVININGKNGETEESTEKKSPLVTDDDENPTIPTTEASVTEKEDEEVPAVKSWGFFK